jgi:putative ABC transport system permease protein
MRPYGYLSLTRARLRAHPWYELLAAVGIAIGVALSVAVLLANASIGRSSEEIVRGVTGTANLQLQARSSSGVEGVPLLRDVRATPGVARAAGGLEQPGVLIGPEGAQQSVNVVGVDTDLAAFAGDLTRSFADGALTLTSGIVLPSATADTVGVPTATTGRPRAWPRVRVEVRGRAADVQVAAVFGNDVLGPVADARAAVMSIERLRDLAGLSGRLTRVLIEAEPGREDEVRDRLAPLAAAYRLNLNDVDADLRLLDQALKPTGQATLFFAIVASLLGFLLAFNAVLLSAPERRRWLAELITINGASPRAVVLLVLLQSLALGVAGSAVGVAVGLLLANGMLHESADYLTPAFTLGSRTVVSSLPIIVGVCAGLLASLLAAVPLLLDLRRGRSLEAVFAGDEDPGNAVATGTAVRLLGAAFLLAVGALAIFVFWQAGALLACGLLAFATFVAVPVTFLAILRGASAVERRSSRRFVLLSLALRELRATTLRYLALASTGAVAVFGAVAIGGARNDLLRGIEQYVTDYVGTADLWITHGADNQATNAFPLDRGALTGLAGVPGVSAVRTYAGSFLDIGDRRVWIIARDNRDAHLVPPSQLRDGDAAQADSRIRERGWGSVSDKLADDLGASVGDTIMLPTPTGPQRITIAATTSNLGWPLGAIVMNAQDYRHWWATDDPSAIEVDLARGAQPDAVAMALRDQLGGTTSGLRVQTAEQRAESIKASARGGLNRLGQISTLLLIAACLAMATALGAAIWQRRPRIAEQNLIGMLPNEQWRALLIESGLVVGAGCLTGAAFGVLGQVVIDSYLVGVTGFPVDLAVTAWTTFGTFLLVVGSALAVVAIPGWFAAHVGAELAFEE